jgi:hydrogenase expression/formation protein HypC
MCLAIPGRVVQFFEQRGLRMAKVQFGGITREVCLEYVPETQVGEYVLVHVGFAISRVDEEEAKRTYELLEAMDQLTELGAPIVNDDTAEGGRE